ncbi:hypothetical protein F5Y03DRAFT_403002 [Xylaria venustula]|nr:hypothetical protein F5Y03DRAFT_403002 [Xylaria venustula]
MQRGPSAPSSDDGSDDDGSDDDDKLRGRALHRVRMKKKITVLKDGDVFRVERIGAFENADTTAFIRKAIHEEAEDREDEVAAIEEWDDLDGDRLFPASDADGDEEHGAVTDRPDPTAFDSPPERRRQIDGFKAELGHHLRGVRRADAILGFGAQANFTTGTPRSPECALNNKRRRAYKQLTRMSRMIGLDEDDDVYSY